MKRQFMILIAIAAFTTALTTSAAGQSSQTLRTKVKFDFQIGDRLYPAGEYWIEPVNAQVGNVLKIRNVRDVNKHQFVLAQLTDAGKRQSPKLVFQKYGESYFLTHIFYAGEQWGYSVRPSPRQRVDETRLASRMPAKN